MLAVQFQTVKKPIERDTRNIWELREDLEKEKKQQVKLNSEIAKYQTLLNQYRQNPEKERTQVMKEAIDQMKEEVGLTDVEGKGVILNIEPLFSEELLGEEVPTLQPELLMRLINQLNSFGTSQMEISNQRVITTTAIREVNGETYVNNRPLPDLPIEIRIISDDAVKLFDQMKASKIIDDFAEENLSITAKLKNKVEISAYDRQLNIKKMKQYKEDS